MIAQDTSRESDFPTRSLSPQPLNDGAYLPDLFFSFGLLELWCFSHNRCQLIRCDSRWCCTEFSTEESFNGGVCYFNTVPILQVHHNLDQIQIICFCGWV